MYTLEQLKDRVIWVFREPRSGGTWLTSELAYRLNRKPKFFDLDEGKDVWGPKREYFLKSYFQKISPQKNDNKNLFNTHEFYGLKIINKFNNPILLRVMRRNITEQFLSQYIASNCTKVLNVYSEQEYNKLPKIEPMYASTDEIFFYIKRCKEKEYIWNYYSSGYENETIYYEDMLQGSNIKLFDIEMQLPSVSTNHKIEGECHRSSIRLPYNKKEIFLNYQEIDTMLQENLGPY